VAPAGQRSPAGSRRGGPQRQQAPGDGAFRRRDLAVASGLVLLALLLRLPGLEANPGWDGDEGYNLDIAWQLREGRAGQFALIYAFVQHPVLYYAFLAPLLALAGPQLWVARALAAVAGALSAGVLYLAVARTGNRRAAFLGALALAGAHFAVAYSRLAYTYNLLLLWTGCCLLAVTAWEETRRRGWLIAATVAAALGLLTDQIGIALPVFVAARALPRHRLAGAVLLGGILPALLAAGAAAAVHPQAALADWSHTFLRLSGGGDAPSGAAPGAPVASWALNYLHLLRAEWWWPAAVAGLFCVRPLVARRRILTLTGLLVLPIFALRSLDPFFRTGIPLLIPGAWGLGALLDAGMRAAYETLAPRRLLGAATAALVVLLPLGLELGRSAGALVSGFRLPIGWALVDSQGQTSARAAARYVDSVRPPGAVVVTSPHVAWLYPAPVSDFLQAGAATGAAVAFYPPGIPPERFRFSPALEPNRDGAEFAVLDPYWDAWARESDVVARLTAEVGRWPLLWSQGGVRVHRRPSGPGGPGG
jgi:4-amino-4-deoxy-L-arabinose transferase-like glycosyltransferase